MAEQLIPCSCSLWQFRSHRWRCSLNTLTCAPEYIYQCGIKRHGKKCGCSDMLLPLKHPILHLEIQRRYRGGVLPVHLREVVRTHVSKAVGHLLKEPIVAIENYYTIGQVSQKATYSASPGGERPHRGSKAGYPPGPAFSEGLFYQLGHRGRVDSPE